VGKGVSFCCLSWAFYLTRLRPSLNDLEAPARPVLSPRPTFGSCVALDLRAAIGLVVRTGGGRRRFRRNTSGVDQMAMKMERRGGGLRRRPHMKMNVDYQNPSPSSSPTQINSQPYGPADPASKNSHPKQSYDLHLLIPTISPLLPLPLEKVTSTTSLPRYKQIL
jgi:hypothetical protein